MKSNEFILVLTKHRQFGWMLKPYGVQKLNKEFYTIIENILNEEDTFKNYTEIQQKLIQLSSQCTEKEIVKLFSKKKLSSRDFLSSLTDEKLITNIREYIERRLIKSFDILRNTDIKLFYKADSKNLFEEDRIKLVPGNARAIFNFIREENGSKYFLSINDGESDMQLSGKPAEIITNFPCILMAGNHLYFFSSGDKGIDGKKLLPFFTKDFVFIPKSAEKKYFETFIKNSLENYDVKAQGFHVEMLNSDPVSVLYFENDWKNEFVFILKFDYEGTIISANYDKNAFVTFYENEGRYYFTKMVRNLSFEEEKHKFLLSFSELQEQNACIYKIKPRPGAEQNLLNWLNANSMQLADNEFVIKQNFHNKSYFTKEISIEFKLKEGNNWFDLYGIVQFGEYKIPFIALKTNLLRNIREYMLPNGEIAILPDEWFAKYSSFFQLNKASEGALRIKRHHVNYFYQVLEEIDKPLIDRIGKIEHTEHEKPEDLRASFRPYQYIGYNWIYSMYINKFGLCLADDMGLGKTLQTLAAILKFSDAPLAPNKTNSGAKFNLFSKPVDDISIQKSNKPKAGIIVMPTSLIHNWINEILKFAPKLKYYNYSGSKRIKDSSEFDDYDLILTSYGILRNDIDLLKDYYYHFIILDESQYVKNPGSKIYQSVIEMQAVFKMVLTGTPIENSLNDLWAQLNFINPGLLGSLEFFRKEFVDPIEKLNDPNEKEIKQMRLQKLISPFILRRTKKEVIDDLPELTESVQYCSMHDQQKLLYDEEKAKIRNSLLQSIEGKDVAQSNMIMIQGLTKLRQLANHPRMIDPNSDFGSGKFEDVMSMLESILAENHKVLIFSSFVKHLDLFVNNFEAQKWQFAMLTGSTSKRDEEINKFQDNPDCRIFLISLKAGGVGLNLTAADYVFFLDPWWNPASENQALSRAHRIGQNNKVMVYRFITEDSIEQKILKLQERKKDLADIFINNNNPFKQLSQEDLIDLFS